MLKYFRDLFTKPEYMWTLKDILIFKFCLIIALIIVISIVYFIQFLIARYKFKHCKGIKTSGDICCNSLNCLHCNCFKKIKKGNKKDDTGV